ncbi:uncharacterized protein LOC116246580 [Nymphaea colorata]|nr:uncharacterized protein LOC116246580 [Nymphaea colorata]
MSQSAVLIIYRSQLQTHHSRLLIFTSFDLSIDDSQQLAEEEIGSKDEVAAIYGRAVSGRCNKESRHQPRLLSILEHRPLRLANRLFFSSVLPVHLRFRRAKTMLRRSATATKVRTNAGPLLLFLILIIVFFSFFSVSLHRADLNPSFFPPSEPERRMPLFATPSPARALNARPLISSSFRFIVKVLAYNRLDSLIRCLRSLAEADYDGDRVDLHVFVDHFKADAGAGNSMDQRLEAARKMLSFVDGFEWRFGEKLVHYRTGNVGLPAQWLEAWWPSSDDEFAFVVEDDLELSPLYYRYLRRLIATYYYESSNYSPSIYGASLQRPAFVAGIRGNKVHLDDEEHIILYQLVGTWGQLLFPKPWKEFRLWYDMHKMKNIQPILEGMVTTRWHRSIGYKIWTPWFVKFVHSRGYYNMYSNFLRERALSVSHREAGVNYRTRAGPDSKLIVNGSLDVDLWDIKPLRSLKWYGYCFNQVIPGRIVKTLNDLSSLLHSLQRDKAVIFVSLYGVAEAISRNLLCHFENLNIQNYIVLGHGDNFLYDLARRGHPVIDTEKLVLDVKRGSWNAISKQGKEVLVTAHVIKKSVEKGYNAWLISGNMIPTGDQFSKSFHAKYDFATANDLELSFFKSSGSKLLHKLIDSVIGGKLSLNKLSFAQLIGGFRKESGLPIKTIDVEKIAHRVTPNQGKKNDLANGRKMIFWSPDLQLTVLEGHLRQLGLWVIDEELSCTSVVCHSS